MGTYGGLLIDLPSDVELGMLDIMANSTDESNISTVSIAYGIALITDAPAFWFGVHISGVDDPEWGGASVLTPIRIRGVARACPDSQGMCTGY